MKPLHGMLVGYSKHKKLQWTPELINVFEATKEEMLPAEEEEEEITLPDLQHLKNEQRERVEGLLKDFKDLFKTRVGQK